MLRPTFLKTCTTITESIAVVSPRSQFGPSTPSSDRNPLMPPSAWSRKLHTIVHATRDTTTGEKKNVRNVVVPGSRWLSSTARTSASEMLSTTSPTENHRLARSESRSPGSASIRS